MRGGASKTLNPLFVYILIVYIVVNRNKKKDNTKNNKTFEANR